MELNDKFNPTEENDLPEEENEEVSEEYNETEDTTEYEEDDTVEQVDEPEYEEEPEETEDDNYTTDEDDIAYVAERITGARHSIVTTAAPLRHRENSETVSMNSLSRIVRESSEKTEEKQAKNSRHNRYVAITAALAVIVVAALSAIIVGVNIAAEKNKPADINIGETTGDYVDLTDNESETEAQPESEETEETALVDTDESAVESETEPESEAESETETETQPPETEPAPKKFNIVLDFYDKDDISVSAEQMTLSELLTLCGITLEEGYVPSVSLDSMIAADTTISIDKYEYATAVESGAIAYETVVYETDLIPRDETNYVQYGEEGQYNEYYTVEYINGQESSRTLQYTETVREPVSEIYELGVGGSFVGDDGVTYTYSYRRVVPATYYNIEGLTYLGTMADETVVAVDKDNIPLGTKLYVKNDKYDFGVRIASDIGGKVDEWEVDIWLSKDNPQFASFSKVGYHYDMEIYYID